MSRVDVIEDDIGPGGYNVLMRYAPGMANALFDFSFEVYDKTGLTVREMEAARIRTAHLNGCEACQQGRAARDLNLGVPYKDQPFARPMITRGPAPDEAFYDAVAQWETSPLFSEREKLAIEYAERLGRDPRSLETDEAFWRRLKAVFADKEVVDLTLSIASWIAVGRVINVLGFSAMCLLPARAAAE